jgi:hypothetical protein
MSSDVVFSQSHSYQDKLEETIGKRCHEAQSGFKQVTRHYGMFHITFLTLGVAELFAFLVFFPFFAKSALIAFALAALLLTGFSYFILLFYFQAKKPQQFIDLKDDFLASCEGLFPYNASAAHKHLSEAEVAQRFAATLSEIELNMYRPPWHVEGFTPLLEKFSQWLHWKDIHMMKETLLLSSIEKLIQVVKVHPCQVDIHARLASAYTALCMTYLDPRKHNSEMENRWVSSDYSAPEMLHKFRLAAERAIEELTIIDIYAPGELWVHGELANLYHLLEQPEKEVLEYETMRIIQPEDRTILLNLGILYFRQGHNAKGLKVYDELKNSGDPKAEELIAHYDAYTVSN